MSDEIYYQHAGRLSIARRISHRARMAVFCRFMEEMKPTRDSTVLDVGVSLDCKSIEANMLEQHYPHLENITCAGIGDGDVVAKTYPGVKYRRITPHARLPFKDGEFDIAYSNAVVEHVGSREQQRAFVREVCRVARAAFIVAPNRLFPVEHHTAVPLIHYLPLPLFRAGLRCTPLKYWGHEKNLNPLFATQVAGLFPAGSRPEIRYAGFGLGWLRSNIIVLSR